MNNRQLPLIHIYGSHYQMGTQIGEERRQNIMHDIENAHHLLSESYEQVQLSWEGARIQSRKYLPFAEERYPQYVDELRGISAGAGVLFDDVAIVNVMEAVTSDALHLDKCTSFGVAQERTENGHVLLAHNEDWVPEDEPDVFLVHARPDGELPFLAMTYGALLPNIGFNAAGIAQCCDSVYPTDSRIGIPRVIVSRAVLAAQSLNDAIRKTLISKRAAGYNHLIAHESGELYNVEVSARQFAVGYAEDGSLVHTNHYLDQVMRPIENNPEELIVSRVRYFRARRLLAQTRRHTVESLQDILKDHINRPDSICNHKDLGGEALERQKTITSLVMDLDNREMHASWGNPCENLYSTYQL